MLLNRVVEYVFFFGLMGVVGYLLWLMMSPFITALALSAVIVTISYPIYGKVLRHTPRNNRNVAAFLSTLIVIVLFVMPLLWITSMLVSEAVSVYRILDNNQFSLSTTLDDFENVLEDLIPGLQLNLSSYLQQGAKWFAGNLGAIFVGTASTILAFFIAIIGSFYLFRDGEKFTKKIIEISPLADMEDGLILKRMASAVRGVATGTVLVAIVQGVSAAIGFTIFDFDRAILFGTIVAITALVPGIGPSVVFIPAAIYSFVFGDYVTGIGLVVWFLVAVSLVDNILGPYLISRSHPMHPFLVLLSVLGGLALFGPIGFIVGPVVTSVFIVLLEIYSQHVSSADNRV